MQNKHVEKRGESSNLAEQEEEEISLLLVTKEDVTRNQRYLDTRCNNHMTGVKEAFSALDEIFRGNVRFGDNSKLPAMGKCQIRVQKKGDGTHIIFMYFMCHA